MEVMLVENHIGEGIFPEFIKGTTVKNVSKCDESEHWLSCEIDTFQIYVPECYIDKNVLTQNYNPTELVVKSGDIVEVLEIVYEWLHVRKDQQYGWLPTYKVISTND